MLIHYTLLGSAEAPATPPPELNALPGFTLDCVNALHLPSDSLD